VKTHFVAYRVTDLERSLDFYTTLGYQPPIHLSA
jgi:catechol 2,3-dioxygenase-like lactoylglutathione lyase family enzyme